MEIQWLALISIVVPTVQSARLTISPSVNVQAGSTALTLRCEAAASAGYTELYSLEIKRNKQQVETQIALVDGRGATASTSKYTITSSYDINAAPTSNFLQVILNNPGCSDVAEFACISKGSANTGDGLDIDRKNMTVQSNPETPEMSVDPDMNLPGYNISSNVTFNCTGSVGNPQKFWSWRFRRSGSSFWQDFNSNADITDGEATPPTATRCSYASSSTLKYTVQSEDHEMMIMCRLDNNDDYSTNYTIRLRKITDPEVTTTENDLSSQKVSTPRNDPPNPTATTPINGGGSSFTQLETGLMVALAVFIIVSISLVVILVIVVKGKYADKSPVADPSPPPPIAISHQTTTNMERKPTADSNYDRLHVYNNSDYSNPNYSSLL